MNRKHAEPPAADLDLVHRAQRGDGQAFAALTLRYQDRVYNTCLRLCCSQADAADLAQTTFLKALESISQFRAGSGFFTWLYRIAVNQFLAGRRGQRRRSELLAEHARGDPRLRAETWDDAGGDLERRELHERLERALAQLDPEFRAAVVLRDVDGLDYERIADVLEVPVGTVKSRIHRGRMMLRELLSDEPRKTLGSASLPRD